MNPFKSPGKPVQTVRFVGGVDVRDINAPVFFLDVSGSTTGDRYYWKCVSEIVAEKAEQGETFVYAWSSSLLDEVVVVSKGCSHEDVHAALDMGSRDRWGMGTRPSVTIPKMKELAAAGVRDIVFVTDGQIGPCDDREACDALRKGDGLSLNSLEGIAIGPFASTSVWTAFSWCADKYSCARYIDGHDPVVVGCSKADLDECIEALNADIMAIADASFRARFETLLQVYASNPDGDLAKKVHVYWTVWMRELRKKQRDLIKPVRFEDLPDDQLAACRLVHERCETTPVATNALFEELERIKPRGIEANLEQETVGRYVTSADLPVPKLDDKDRLLGKTIMMLPLCIRDHPDHVLTMPAYFEGAGRVEAYSADMGDTVIVPEETYSKHNRLVVVHRLCRGKAVGNWILWLAGAVLSTPEDGRSPEVTAYVVSLLNCLDYSFSLGGLDVDKPKGNVFDAFRYSIGKSMDAVTNGDGDLMAATFMARRRIEMLELQVGRSLSGDFADVLELADFVRDPKVSTAFRGPDNKIRRSTLEHVAYVPVDGVHKVYLDAIRDDIAVPRIIGTPAVVKAKGLSDHVGQFDPRTFKHVDFDRGFTHAAFLELCERQGMVPLPLYSIARRLTVSLGRFPTQAELVAAGAKKMARLTGRKVVSEEIRLASLTALLEFEEIVQKHYGGDHAEAVRAISYAEDQKFSKTSSC